MNSQSVTSDYSAFYPLWGRQLLAEFANINWQYGQTLKTPVFTFSESTRQYGSWQANIRTISLSVKLIANHSWDVTLMVLKHEMAHQLCSEYFQQEDAGHGHIFQKACDLLGMPPVFRLAAGDLPETIASTKARCQQTQQRREVIQKIGKLLAMAGSTNEYEAAIAMEKAGQLMARHNLRQLQEEERSAFTTRLINTGARRIDAWQQTICAILLRFFYVKVVTASLYDPLRNTSHKTIELLGREENVEIASYCYAFLTRQLSTLWQQNRIKMGASGLRGRNSYYLGLLQGFYDRLQAQETHRNTPAEKKTTMPASDRQANVTTLVSTENKALEHFVGTRHPRLRKRSGKGAMIHRDTYEQGRTDGKQIIMPKGVAGKGQQQGLMLPER
jgi:predicted SprT family Zn-dependent metalloprotease